MDITNLFASNYLKSSDLGGQTRRVTIAKCQAEQIGQEREIKPVVYFAGVPKAMVLNKTNATLLAAAFGPETDHWAGREIELVSEMVMFQGRATPGLRVRVPATAAPAAAPQGAFAASMAFQAPAPATAAPPAQAAPAAPAPAAAPEPTPAPAPAAEPAPAPAPPPAATEGQQALPFDDDIKW